MENSLILPGSAYLGAPDAVARMLIGKVLVRTLGETQMAGRIVETEAYFGLDDPAAHAFAGRTPRNEVLFGPPGHAYVYFIYGLHTCLNVSCEPEGKAGCVLIRALEPLRGLETMAENRKLPAGKSPALLTAGPGRLCQALAIRRDRHNGMDLTSAHSELQIRDEGSFPAEIAVTPRIGIRQAMERPLRFIAAGHPCLSRGRYWRPGGKNAG